MSLNPGPSTQGIANSEAVYAVGGQTLPGTFTFATLPAASGYSIGTLAYTTDAGWYQVTGTPGYPATNAWAALATPTSTTANLVQRYLNVDGFTALTAPGQGSFSIQYVPIAQSISATRMDVLASYGAASSATANTAGIQYTFYGGIYTRTGSSLSAIKTATNAVSWTYASNNSGSTQFITTAIRPLSIPLAVSLSPGEYYVGFGMSTATSSVGTATTALAQSLSIMGYNSNQSALNYAEFSAGNTATNVGLYPMGIWTSAVSAAPASIAFTDIAQTGGNQSAAQFAFVLRNY